MYLILILIVLVVILIMKYIKVKCKYWKNKGVSIIEPVPLLGSTKDLLLFKKSSAEFFKNMYESFPEEPYVGFYRALSPFLMIRDPGAIKTIMTELEYFPGRGILYNKSDFLMDNVLFMRGEKWRLTRKQITPVFTIGKLTSLFPLFQECGRDLQKYLLVTITKHREYELRELMENYTITMIGSTGFGIDLKLMHGGNSMFNKMVKKAFVPSLGFLFNMWMETFTPYLYKILGVKRFGEREKYFFNLVTSIMKQRKISKTIRNDFIDICLQLKERGVIKSNIVSDFEIKVTDRYLTGQAYAFLLAGFEGATSALSFALYELAKNPQIQEKLMIEIDMLFKKNNNTIDKDFLDEAVYLDCFIQETYRMYPTLSIFSRICTKDFELKTEGRSLKIDKGTHIVIPVHALHNDSKYFPNPDVFQPERFSHENMKKNVPFSYMPFGEGPRMCVGRRFGDIQVKVGLISIMEKFDIRKTSRTQDKIEFLPTSLILKPKDGLWVELIPRNKFIQTSKTD